MEYYLGAAQERRSPNGSSKWQFVCPFCGPLASKEYKKWQKKGALLWNAVQNSWVFSCAKKGSVECMGGKTLGNDQCVEPSFRRGVHEGALAVGHHRQGA